MQHVYDMLKDEILSLNMKPGSPVDEVLISERMGSSRTPVREALVRLSAEGLVEILPNRATMVAQIDFLNLRSFFDALTLMYRVTARNAAELHRESDLAAIRYHQERFARAVEGQDAIAMIATNRDFHAAIAEAGRNPYYTTLFLRLLDDGRRLLRLYYLSYDDKLPKAYVTEHEDMITAIEARNIDLCDRLGGAHADQIVRQIQKLTRNERGPQLPL
ncbi:GntR family transcriptional regulator [Paracoccus litorisediminis]|uniref:GntR family transcriptional regulator n=1 Tax=Paracoccus litorisediminis TaxID=2006130 RepID=UPI003733DD50